MSITFVNSAQIAMHAQVIAVMASLLCGGFAVYLITVYRRVYPTSSKAVLGITALLSLIYLEILRHIAMAHAATLGDAATHNIMGACFSSIAFGLLLILLAMNHDRLVRTIRQTFTETTSVIRTSKLSQLTRTQQFRIIENYDFDDIINTLNIMSSPSTARLLTTINLTGWGLIAANLLFLIVLEFTNHV